MKCGLATLALPLSSNCPFDIRIATSVMLSTRQMRQTTGNALESDVCEIELSKTPLQ